MLIIAVISSAHHAKAIIDQSAAGGAEPNAFLKRFSVAALSCGDRGEAHATVGRAHSGCTARTGT